MSGKAFVIGIGFFFVVFFVIETWMMKGLPH